MKFLLPKQFDATLRQRMVKNFRTVNSLIHIVLLLVEQKPVNVNLQIIIVFIPFVWIWGFYRIEKIRRGLGLMFGIFVVVFLVAIAVQVITGTAASEFTNVTIVFYLLRVLIGIYYIRKWSIEWNKKMSVNP